MAAANTGKSRFFKVLMPESSNFLVIPPSFMRNITREPPWAASMVVPSGRECPVLLDWKDGEAATFKDGWADFRVDHHLVHGDFLVFKFNGQRKFKVFMFDHSGCEKNTHQNRTPTEKHHNRTPTEKDKDITMASDPELEEKNNATLSGLKSKGRYKFTKARLQKHNSSYEQSKNVNEAVKLADTFKSKHPWFKSTMNNSAVSKGYMHIPHSFASEYLPKRPTMMTLVDQEGRKWPVRKIVVVLSGGWMKFSRDHKLKVGDICIFELIKESVLRVLIFR